MSKKSIKIAQYDEDTAVRVYDYFKSGKLLSEICAELMITKNIFNDWLKDGEKQELRDAYALGLDACEAYWVSIYKQGINGTLKGFNANSAKHFLEANFPNWRVTEKTETIVQVGDVKTLSPEEIEKRIAKFEKKAFVPKVVENK